MYSNVTRDQITGIELQFYVQGHVSYGEQVDLAIAVKKLKTTAASTTATKPEVETTRLTTANTMTTMSHSKKK